MPLINFLIMKKLFTIVVFVFLLGGIFCEAQLIDTSLLNSSLYPHITSETTDAAYKASQSKLYGIWYTSNGNEYFVINANGSGSMNTLSDSYNGIKIVWQQNFQWQKQNGEFMIRFVGEAKFTLAESDQTKYEKLTRNEKDALLRYFSSLTPQTRNSQVISDKILFLDKDNIVLKENYGNLWLVNKNYIPKLKEIEAKRKQEEIKKERLAQQFEAENAIDLGLSVKWARINVGANAPEESGNYYAWGETNIKDTYTAGNSTTYGKKIPNDISGTSNDAARVNWGGQWRMPTDSEIKELIVNCSWEWTNLNGRNGYKVTGPNGNSIFIPAVGFKRGNELFNEESGFYFSSTPHVSNNNSAYNLNLDNIDKHAGWSRRYDGRAVRPVISK